MLNIHHINCGTLNPYGGRLLDGFSHGTVARLVSHCWIVETNEGLVLVDTGFNESQVQDPQKNLNPFIRKLLRPELRPTSTIKSHIIKLGFDPRDVKHIVVTQLGAGHADGIADFPDAQVHVMQSELECAQNPNSWMARRRYTPAAWNAQTKFQTYTGHGRDWYGLPGAQALRGLPTDILYIPLAGHTWGHAGVAVKTDQGWMLHAGASYFYREEVDVKHYRCPIGLRILQNLMEINHTQRLVTLQNLRRLVRDHSADVRVCSSNDAIEFTAYQASAEPIRKLQRLNFASLSRKHSRMHESSALIDGSPN